MNTRYRRLIANLVKNRLPNRWYVDDVSFIPNKSQFLIVSDGLNEWVYPIKLNKSLSTHDNAILVTRLARKCANR